MLHPDDDRFTGIEFPEPFLDRFNYNPGKIYHLSPSVFYLITSLDEKIVSGVFFTSPITVQICAPPLYIFHNVSKVTNCTSFVILG